MAFQFCQIVTSPFKRCRFNFQVSIFNRSRRRLATDLPARFEFPVHWAQLDLSRRLANIFVRTVIACVLLPMVTCAHVYYWMVRWISVMLSAPGSPCCHCCNKPWTPNPRDMNCSCNIIPSLAAWRRSEDKQRESMNQKQLIKASIDEYGRIVLPPEIASRFGIQPGIEVYLDEGNNEVRLLRPATQLAKIYIEVTNLCNLDCVTCMRNVWGEPPGKMSDKTFESIFET